jgi:hypothetical protein
MLLLEAHIHSHTSPTTHNCEKSMGKNLKNSKNLENIQITFGKQT